jgi:menaquinone-specific isochorismate synthase
MTSLPAGDRSTPATASAPLVSRTVPIDPEIGAALLSLVPAGAARDVVSWVRRGEGVVGWGRAASHTASGPDRIAELDRWWAGLVEGAVVRDEVGRPGSGPIAFGSVSYAASSAAGATLVVPDVVVGCRSGVAWLTTVGVEPAPAVAAVPGRAELAVQPAPDAPRDVAFADGALSPAQWAGAVAEAVARITSGGLDKVVLARDLEVTTSGALDVRWLLQRLAERYDTTWVFAVDGLVGATPELLVRREKGLVTSRVLAGTIRRTGDDEHDLALAASLARSSKDLEEHEYAVRSVSEALAPHCSSMNVPEAPFVLHLSNVMHLATDVAGVLVDDVSSLSLAESLHPSAAVCGTPAPEADAVIAELEHMDRERYAGPVGWIDATGDGEWGIALRCGSISVEDPSRIRLFAGCGIVAGSDPAAEVAESSAKLVPMRDALTAPPPTA